MRAMILAAGRGERMQALTLSRPKPLLTVGKHYLIEYAILQCQAAGITDIVINVCYHADQIMQALGDGSRYGVSIAYSVEKERLETGGGIVNALPLLGDQPFVVLASDIISAYDLKKLCVMGDGLAHLVLVPNPGFHTNGDFGLMNGWVSVEATPKYTFGSIGILHPALFEGCQPVRFPLRDVFIKAMAQPLITGEIYHGPWYNVGNPSQLAEVQALVNSTSLLS